LKLENEEVSLLRALNKFPEVVELAGEKFAPNILCNYLFDLAQKFNLFYQKHKIIGSDQEDFRLTLTAGVGQVIKNGLNLLGIEALEKM
jgi:arginyl-tRNA synthetase